MWLDFNVRDYRRWTFSLEEELLWIMTQWLKKFKNILMLDLFHLLSSPDVNWWTGVVWITCGLLWCFYQLFGLSFWRHPFTAEHPLLRHWCRDTFLQTWWRNKLILILDGLSVSQYSANAYFGELFPQICICTVKNALIPKNAVLELTHRRNKFIGDWGVFLRRIIWEAGDVITH